MISRTVYKTEAEWLAARVEGATFGASEIPALFDAGFLTREKLLAEKISGTRRRIDSRAQKRMNIGKLLEPTIGMLTIADLKRTSAPIACGFTIYKHETYPHMHATPDFWIREGVELIEAKSTGPDGLSKWGDWSGFGGRFAWSKEPPLDVVLQVQAQFACTGAVSGHIACLAGTEFQRWHVERDPELIEMIADAVRAAVEEINEARESRKEAQP